MPLSTNHYNQDLAMSPFGRHRQRRQKGGLVTSAYVLQDTSEDSPASMIKMVLPCPNDKSNSCGLPNDISVKIFGLRN